MFCICYINDCPKPISCVPYIACPISHLVMCMQILILNVCIYLCTIVMHWFMRIKNLESYPISYTQKISKFLNFIKFDFFFKISKKNSKLKKI